MKFGYVVFSNPGVPSVLVEVAEDFIQYGMCDFSSVNPMEFNLIKHGFDAKNCDFHDQAEIIFQQLLVIQKFSLSEQEESNWQKKVYEYFLKIKVSVILAC